jgi:hypothetical protein
MATCTGTVVLSAEHGEVRCSHGQSERNPARKAIMFVVIVIEHPTGSGDVAYMNEDVVVAKALKF